ILSGLVAYGGGPRLIYPDEPSALMYRNCPWLLFLTYRCRSLDRTGLKFTSLRESLTEIRWLNEPVTNALPPWIMSSGECAIFKNAAALPPCMGFSRRDFLAGAAALLADMPARSLEARISGLSGDASQSGPFGQDTELAAANSIFLTVEKQMTRGSPGYDMAVRALRRGHAIGNHSYSHPFLAKASANKARMEIKQTGDIIASLYNEAGRHNPKLFRFPYRSIGHEGMIRREFGLQIVGWDYDTSDYRSEGRNTGKSMGIIRGAQEHAIVLMHDYPGTATVIRQLGAYGIASQALGPGGAAQYGLNVRHPVPFC